MIDMYDVTNLEIGKHQIQDYEGIYSTAQILSEASNQGIVKTVLSIGTDTIYNSTFLRFKLRCKTSRLKVAWKIRF